MQLEHGENINPELRKFFRVFECLCACAFSRMRVPENIYDNYSHHQMSLFPTRLPPTMNCSSCCSWNTMTLTWPHLLLPFSPPLTPTPSHFDSLCSLCSSIWLHLFLFLFLSVSFGNSSTNLLLGCSWLLWLFGSRNRWRPVASHKASVLLAVTAGTQLRGRSHFTGNNQTRVVVFYQSINFYLYSSKWQTKVCLYNQREKKNQLKPSRAVEGNSDKEEKPRTDSDFRGSEVICFDQMGFKADAKAEKETERVQSEQSFQILDVDTNMENNMNNCTTYITTNI